MGLIRDLNLLSQEFENMEFPKNKRYMLKYFDTVLQEAFLKYVFVFGDYENFVDHTGLQARKHWLVKLYKKLEKIEKTHKEAKASEDPEFLQEVETGQMILKEEMDEIKRIKYSIFKNQDSEDS